MRYALLALVIAGFGSEASAASVQEVLSDKGFKAWLIEEHSLPLVAVKIAFTGSGYAYDPEDRLGRASMLAAALMEGAGEMESSRFSEALESRAISVQSNADEDMLQVAMETLSEHKEAAFSYLGLALTHPRFDAEPIERVRGQMRSLLAQQEQDPAYLAGRAWQQLAFGVHPYAKPQAGDRKGIDRLSSRDLHFAAEHYLTRENILIGVAGDITPVELKRLLDEHLDALPKRYAPEITLPEIDVPQEARTQSAVMDTPQTVVIFGTRGLKRSDPDYLAAYVMNHIIGGGLPSRLGKELREKRGLTYGVASHMEPMAHAASWKGGFSTRRAEAEAAQETLKKTLLDFVHEGPSAREFEDAKRFLTGSFVLHLDSNADIANFLVSMQAHKLGIDYLSRRNVLVEAVKRDDVIAVARKLIDPHKIIFATAGKAEK